MIPFHTGVQVTGTDFCPRNQELSWLRECLESAGRVYVVGERRIGKSSLIAEAVRTAGRIQPVFVDLMALKDLEDLTHRLGQALILAEKRQSRLLALVRHLASLRPLLSLDSQTGAAAVSFAPGSGGRLETLDELFSAIGKLKSAVVVFDEFQDVLQIDDAARIIARLRNQVQTQQKAAFVFSGSVRNDMEDIFTQEKSPFFNSAVRIHVGPLDRVLFRDYLSERFARGQRRISGALLDIILDACNDNPGHVQRFCISLWQTTAHGQQISEADLAAAWSMVFSMQRDSYELLIAALSVQQMKVLRALAHGGGETALTADFISRTGITLAASVRKAMLRLTSLRLVHKTGTKYRFSDPFMAAWIRQQPL